MNSTTDTILLVGHGSREESGNQEIHAFVEQWCARRPDWRIELCFIEFAPPSLHDGLVAHEVGARKHHAQPEDNARPGIGSVGGMRQEQRKVILRVRTFGQDLLRHGSPAPGFPKAEHEQRAGADEHHDHLIDIRSGKVIEFVDPELEALQRQIAEKLGYRLVDHRMELYGVRLGREGQ